MKEETFDEWLQRTSAIREYLREYASKGNAFKSPDGLGINWSSALDVTDAAARIRNEISAWVLLNRSRIMFQVRKDNPELNSRERETIEKSLMVPYQTILDDCETSFQSCKSRYFEGK